jgi:hypothetical protein
MCGPMMMMAPLAIMGAAVQAQGAQQSANAQANQYLSQANAHQANADLKKRQAVLELTSGQQKQRRQQEQIGVSVAKQVNQYASSGLLIEGTPMDIAADTAREMALDAAAIGWSAQLKATNQEYEAKIDEMNAESARRAAGEARKAGRIGAASAMIGGFTSLAGSFRGL